MLYSLITFSASFGYSKAVVVKAEDANQGRNAHNDTKLVSELSVVR